MQILTEFDRVLPTSIRYNCKIEKASVSWRQHMLTEDIVLVATLQLIKE